MKKVLERVGFAVCVVLFVGVGLGLPILKQCQMTWHYSSGDVVELHSGAEVRIIRRACTLMGGSQPKYEVRICGPEGRQEQVYQREIKGLTDQRSEQPRKQDVPK